MSKALKGLLAMAVLMFITLLFSSNVEAKEHRFFIGNVLHSTNGQEGRVIDSTTWVEKGKTITLTWTDTAKTAVKVKKIQSSKVTKSALKKYQKKSAQKQNQPTSSKAQYIKATANASTKGAAFEPAAPPTFWSKVARFLVWPFGHLSWDPPVVIPKAIVPAPATVQAAPPAKTTKLKRRVIKKHAPPKTSKRKQDGIKVMKVIPAPKPLHKTVAAPCPHVGPKKPALDRTRVEKPAGKLADWEVSLVTYRKYKDGRKQKIREYLRSPAECYDNRSPDYSDEPGPGFDIAEDRYDRHTYAKTSEKPVKPGTVVQFALSPEPDDLTMRHIVREIDKKSMEVLDVALGQFRPVDKTDVQEIAYPTEYHKFYAEKKVMPTKELFEYTRAHRCPNDSANRPG